MSFPEHAAKGAVFGALVGGAVAAFGWVVRQRNEVPIDLGVPAPNLMRHRALAEALLHFHGVSHHSAATRALFAQIVQDCEFVVGHEDAKGGAQVAVQKRITQAIACCRKLAHLAFKHRDPASHDCRAQIETVEGHLTSVQKNMMMG